MLLGVPVSELLLLAGLILVGGLVTGILAGLFGIGGGALIVPVLYEVFRVLGVPEQVIFQLCVGTSLAIIVPTNVRSFLAHRAKGAVMMDVVRAWALPAVIGVVVGSVIAAFAPVGVLKIAFVADRRHDRVQAAGGRDDWRIADDLPGRTGMTAYGFVIGLGASLMGISGGSISNMILTLHGKPMLKAVATSAGLGVPITIVGTIGYMLAGLPQQALMPPLSIGFVSLIGFALMAPVSSFTAPYGARLAHALLETQARDRVRPVPADGLRAVSGEPGRLNLRLPAHHQPVAAHLPALQPVEEAHAEQVGAQLPGLRDQRRHGAFDDAADRRCGRASPARRARGRWRYRR